MTKSEIRLRYSGLVVFATNVLSIATRLAFMLMVTRSISADEYGIWGNVGDVYEYFIVFAGIFPFWATRFVARGHMGSAKTGLIGNALLSIALASINLATVPILLPALKVSSLYTLLYGLLSVEIVEWYALTALEAIVQAKQPQSKGYGTLLYETCKVIVGFILIMQFKLGLLGALCSMLISYFFQIVFYIKLTISEIRESVDWTFLKGWVKASPINLYSIAGNRIAAVRLIFLFIYGGELARAYYGAAVTIAGIIGYSSTLAYALYPKLLSEANVEDVHVSLKMVLSFAVPMAVGAIALSDAYLAILNPVYAKAKLVLSVLAMDTLCMVLSQLFDMVIMGYEKVDVKASVPFWQLAKSRLFKIFTIPYIQSAVTLPATFIILNYVVKTPLEATTYFVLIGLTVHLAMLLYRYVIARECSSFSFPWKTTGKYVIASAVMTTILSAIAFPARLSLTVGRTFLGAAAYFVTLALIDEETRLLMKSILREISKRGS
ncbi:MAG: hypothetical protein ACETV1_02465 [Candidatus Bathyarchaeia archaeon]